MEQNNWKVRVDLRCLSEVMMGIWKKIYFCSEKKYLFPLKKCFITKNWFFSWTKYFFSVDIFFPVKDFFVDNFFSGKKCFFLWEKMFFFMRKNNFFVRKKKFPWKNGFPWKKLFSSRKIFFYNEKECIFTKKVFSSPTAPKLCTHFNRSMTNKRHKTH